MKYNKFIDYDRVDDNLREYRGFIFKRSDPYGFWNVFDEKGKEAKGFSTYTDTYLARVAVDAHHNKK